MNLAASTAFVSTKPPPSWSHSQNNHAFLDGNRRISLAATDTLLRANGHYLELETIAAHKFITESITKREFRVRQIREWLIAHVQPVEEE